MSWHGRADSPRSGTCSHRTSVTGDGWVAGLQLAGPDAARPAQPWQPPAYADPERLREREVTVGSGDLAVGGTLALPRAEGPHPAVVRLAGSGPLDRDGTVGRNKPFKDLAWGLASRGVAVLRFDKVTLTQRPTTADFTLDDEYLHHATAATHLLRGEQAVEPSRVFVLGHSLGGTAAPRVVAADVTVRVYDADNHMFFPGSGPSTPAEYEPAQHMDPAVVADIAAWLHGRPTPVVLRSAG